MPRGEPRATVQANARIDPEAYRQVAAEARRRRATIASLVEEAIVQWLERLNARRVQEVSGGEPGAV